MKKILAVFMAAAMGLALCSCEFTDTVKNKVDQLISSAENAAATESPLTGEQEEQPETENGLTVGILDFDTFNPYMTVSSTVQNVCGFIYEPLFTMGGDMRTSGVLADSYTIGADGASITIRLKENVIWHDGSAFTAQDVIYSINTLRANQTRYTRLVESINGLWSPDDLTVCATFNHAMPDAVSLFIFPIVKNNSLNSAGADFVPNGTGPFYMADGVSKAQLLAFDGHHDSRAGIDFITLRYIPDAEKLVSLFNANEIDIATSDDLDMSTFMPRSNAQVLNYTTNNMVMMGFNTQSDKFCDAQTRRAISLMIDRDAIATHTYYSRAAAADYAVNPQSWLNPDGRRKIKNDDSAAAVLLQQAGWEPDYQGRYCRDNGGYTVYLSFEILVNQDSPERAAAARQIADRLTAVGIPTGVKLCSYNDFNALVASHNYDAFIGEYELLPNNDLTPLVGSGGNYFGYANADMDALVAQISTVQTESDISEVASELYSLLRDESPFAPICFIKRSLVTCAKVKGGAEPSVEGFVRRAENWSVR